MNRRLSVWRGRDQKGEAFARLIVVIIFEAILLLFGIADLCAATHYVSAGSTNPLRPFLTWATAATNLQQALIVATAGEEVVASNGVYLGGLTLTNSVTVRSCNGPLVTIIDGRGTAQCVSLTAGASLTGFTLTNGGGRNVAYGGGAFCGAVNAFLTNCQIVGNSAYAGGGVYGGTLVNCTVAGNSAQNIGGGAWDCTLYYCVVTNNTALGSSDGGGAAASTLFNCTLTGNSAYDGGGAWYCTLYNSTLSGNLAVSAAGGAAASTLYNCIVYFNTAANGANYDAFCSLNYCCSMPQPATGLGNITADPLFANYPSGCLRLQSNSPCINAGNNAYVTTTTDLDGRARIVGGTVDLGVYEFQPGIDGAFIGWLQQYGLPADGSADFADTDGDGMNNWQEWVAGTSPTNAASALRLLPLIVTPPGLRLSWSSDTNHAYSIERTTSLNSPAVFTLLRTDVLGQAGTTTYLDTDAPAGPAVFYRIGTDSTNGSAPLWLQPPQFVPAGLVVTWTSVTNRTYFLERAANLCSPFSLCASNIAGQAVTTTWTDTYIGGTGAFIYRVGVKYP